MSESYIESAVIIYKAMGLKEKTGENFISVCIRIIEALLCEFDITPEEAEKRTKEMLIGIGLDWSKIEHPSAIIRQQNSDDTKDGFSFALSFNNESAY